MFLLAALALGFLGSFHCIGMCGPIALSIPVRSRSFASLLSGALLYNSGRIITYALIGFTFGLFGTGFVLAGWQNVLSVSLGIILLLVVVLDNASAQVFFTPTLKGEKLVQRGFGESSLSQYAKTPGTGTEFVLVSPALKGAKRILSGALQPMRLFMKIKNRMGALLLDASAGSLFLFGLLNGLLPCGLVYLGIAGAMATGDAVNGALFMAAFGAGTLPAMLGMGLIRHKINAGSRIFIRRAVPFLAAAMAVLLILRGLNLGIPYISPKMEVTATGMVGQECCVRK